MTHIDETLLARWVNDQDAEAFAEIASRYSAMVYATCRRVLGSDMEAEDVTQECFEILVQAGSRPGEYLGPWLHKIATHRSLNRIRANTRRRKHEACFSDLQKVHAEVEWNDIYSYVDEAVGELPEKSRIPLIAHFFENRSHANIAQSLGIPRRTVTYRIQKGIDLVRKSLKRRHALATGKRIS